ncbi:MAG: opine dehydrogenase [Clostridium sp.]|jgi:opine dehydrogenase
MKLAILGSGNGGCTVAAHMALLKHDVSIWDFEKFPQNINAIIENGGISINGSVEGFAKLKYAGFDVEQAIDGAEMILVVGPAYSIKNFALAVKPYLKKGQLVCVTPSSCGGAIVFKEALGVALDNPDYIVGEVSTMPYATRVYEPGKVNVYHELKGGLYFAALPSDSSNMAFKMFNTLYPCSEHAKSLLMTMLQTGNTIIHPSVTILNAGRIESTQGDFLFYEDGATPAAGKLMKALDDEKLALSDVLDIGIIRDTKVKILQEYNSEESYENGYRTAPGFLGIKAQSTLDTRYMNEDVGYSLVFISELAKQVNVPTPTTDAVILIASTIINRDYRAEKALTPATLGIDKMNVTQMKELFGQNNNKFPRFKTIMELEKSI